MVEESESVESIRLPCFNYYCYYCPVSIVRTIRSAADAFISQEQLHKMLFIILPAVQIYLFVLLVQLTTICFSPIQMETPYFHPKSTHINQLVVGWLVDWLIG